MVFCYFSDLNLRVWDLIYSDPFICVQETAAENWLYSNPCKRAPSTW